VDLGLEIGEIRCDENGSSRWGRCGVVGHKVEKSAIASVTHSRYHRMRIDGNRAHQSFVRKR